MRALWLSFALVAGACEEPPPNDARTVRVARAGESTYVAISETNIRRNPSCVRYCDRLAACWYAVSTGSMPLTSDEVRKKCLSEQDDCRTRTRTSYCCGAVDDCLAFAECHAKSTDEPGECRVQPPAK